MKFTTIALSVSAFALALTVAPVFAGNLAGSKPSEPAYNPATMDDVQGTIAAVRQVSAGSPLEGVHLTLKSKTSTLDVLPGAGGFSENIQN